MENNSSREKLTSLEEGLIWQHETGNPKLVIIKRREQTLTRCMKLLFACLAIVLLVLIFYHFRLLFIEFTSTEKAIERLERIETERNAMMNCNGPACDTDQRLMDPKTENFSTDSYKDILNSTEASKHITISTEKINEASDETTEASNDINDEKLKVSSSSEMEKFLNNITSFVWSNKGKAESIEDEAEHITTEKANEVEGKIDLGRTQMPQNSKEIIEDDSDGDYQYLYDYSEEGETESTTIEGVKEVEENIDLEKTQTLKNSEGIIGNDSDNDYQYLYDYSEEEETESTTIEGVKEVEENIDLEETQTLKNSEGIIEDYSDNDYQYLYDYSEEEETESTTIEGVKEVEGNIDIEETQTLKNSEGMIKDNSENDHEYSSDYSSYDHISSEPGYEYDDATELIPYPSLIDNSDEALKTNLLNVKPDDVLPTSFNADSLPDTLIPRPKIIGTSINDKDTNELVTMGSIIDRLSKQDHLVPNNDFIDKYFRELETKRLAEANNYLIHNKSFTEDGSYYSDWWEEEDFDIQDQFKLTELFWPWSHLQFELEGNDDFRTVNNLSNTQSSVGQAIDEQNVKETTEQGTTQELIFDPDLQFLKNIIGAEHSTEKNAEVSISSSDENVSPDPPAQESSTIEPSSTSSDMKEDSQEKDDEVIDDEVDDAMTNLKTSSKSSADSDEIINRFKEIQNDLLREFCETYDDWDEIGLWSFLFEKSEISLLNECSSLRNKKFDGPLEHPISKRSLTGESVHERVKDSQSGSRAAQILDTIQGVIKQDRHFLEYEKSKIFGRMNPVVESRINDLYEKMELVSAHIDKLHERYLRKNKLEDDYVSQEFPSDA